MTDGEKKFLPIISLVGLSGSGKTTAILGAVSRLKRVGLSNICVAKHASEKIDVSAELSSMNKGDIHSYANNSIRKDSHLFKSAGARMVMLVSLGEGKLFLTVSIPNGNEFLLNTTSLLLKEKSLSSICAEHLLPTEKMDILIAEGFSGDRKIPHIHIGARSTDKKISGEVLADFPSVKNADSADGKNIIDKLAAYLYIFYALSTPRPVIVGVGNPLRGDDAFGSKISESLLRDLSAIKKKWRKDVAVIDAGTTPENYVVRILAARPSAIVIFDAVADFFDKNSMGCSRVAIFSPDDISRGAVKFSTHGGGLKMFLDYLKMEMGDGFPPSAIVGVKAHSVSIGSNMSEDVASASRDIKRFILKVLARRQLKQNNT